MGYFHARGIIIEQEPGAEGFWISNITVNMIVLFGLVGASCPIIRRRLFPKSKEWLTFVLLAAALGILMVLYSLIGYELWWI